MKKWILSLCLVILNSHPIQAEGVTAFHKLRPGETLWFVSQVYYGDGNQYTKLMAANKLKSAQDIDVDQELAIPDPMWLETMPKFEAHYQSLTTKRDVALQRQKATKWNVALEREKNRQILRTMASEAAAVPMKIEQKTEKPRDLEK